MTGPLSQTFMIATRAEPVAPGAASWIAEAAARLAAALGRARRARRARRQLERLDDRMLDDIGLARRDIAAAVSGRPPRDDRARPVLAPTRAERDAAARAAIRGARIG